MSSRLALGIKQVPSFPELYSETLEGGREERNGRDGRKEEGEGRREREKEREEGREKKRKTSSLKSIQVNYMLCSECSNTMLLQLPFLPL